MEHRSELLRSQARPSRIEPAFSRRDRVPGPLQHLPRHAPCVRRLRQRPDHRLRPESRRGSRPRETAPRPAGRPRVVGISKRAHRLLRSIDSHHHDELLTGKEYAYDSMRRRTAGQPDPATFGPTPYTRARVFFGVKKSVTGRSCDTDNSANRSRAAGGARAVHCVEAVRRPSTAGHFLHLCAT